MSLWHLSWSMSETPVISIRPLLAIILYNPGVSDGKRGHRRCRRRICDKRSLDRWYGANAFKAHFASEVSCRRCGHSVHHSDRLWLLVFSDCKSSTADRDRGPHRSGLTDRLSVGHGIVAKRAALVCNYSSLRLCPLHMARAPFGATLRESMNANAYYQDLSARKIIRIGFRSPCGLISIEVYAHVRTSFANSSTAGNVIC